MTETPKRRRNVPVRLYLKRAEAGLTIPQLAEKTGVAVGTISRAENGGGVRVDTIQRLAEGLGCEIEDLLADEPTQAAS